MREFGVPHGDAPPAYCERVVTADPPLVTPPSTPQMGAEARERIRVHVTRAVDDMGQAIRDHAQAALEDTRTVVLETELLAARLSEDFPCL